MSFDERDGSYGGLTDRMRALALKHPDQAEALRKRADKLDAVCADSRATAPAILSAWAHARGLYCKISGEALV